MLGHRLRRGPWEQRFSNLSSTRHLCGQFRRLTISNANDATNRSAPLPSITAEIEKGQRKPSRELKVGKDCQRLSKVCGQQEVTLFKRWYGCEVLAQWGIAARRKAETIIADGRVTVNGECVTIPQTLVRFKRDNVRDRYEPNELRTVSRRGLCVDRGRWYEYQKQTTQAVLLCRKQTGRLHM